MSFASERPLPPNKTSTENSCKFDGGTIYLPTEGSDHPLGEVVGTIEEGVADARYDVSSINRKKILNMGFSLSTNYPYALSGERNTESGNKEKVFFDSGHKLIFTRENGTLKEQVSYLCEDTVENYTARNAKAHFMHKGSDALLPTNFIVRLRFDYKFDIQCFDDWGDPLLTPSRVQGDGLLRVQGRDSNGILGWVRTIVISNQYQQIIDQIENKKDLIEYCELSNIKQRPDRSIKP